jgi:hypothetical protein
MEGRHTDMEIGPLFIQVLEPHKRWAVRLGDNPQGLRCDVEFEGIVPTYLCDPSVRATAEWGRSLDMGTISNRGSLRARSTCTGGE